MAKTTTAAPEPNDDQPKQKRGRRGEGTIYWDETKSCYRGEISLGLSPAGKRLRPKVYGDTKAEVREGFKRLLDEHEHGIDTSNKYTVAQCIEDLFERGLKTQGAETIKRLRSDADNHIIPGLGQAKLKKLTPDDVDDWLTSLRTKLSTASLRRCLSILRRAIRLAERRNKISRNVAALVEVPEGRKGRPSRSMSLEEAQRIMDATTGWFHAYLVVSMLTGVRTEEARALRWDHVHLEPEGGIPPHVEVWRSVRKGGDTKTPKSRRTVALPPTVVTVLTQWRTEQRDSRKRNGHKWEDITYVFGTRNDEIKEARAVRKSMRRALKNAEMDARLAPRELRHTFVSLMSDHGASDELIADLVGHRLTNTTRTVYRHQLRPVITKGADIIGSVFDRQLQSDSKR